jgi:cytidine deaminase
LHELDSLDFSLINLIFKGVFLMSAFEQLSSEDQELLLRARTTSVRAYAPYSGFGVGAAVRSRAGFIYVGANLENASYGLTLCAECSALSAALTAEDFRVEAIAVIGGHLDGHAGSNAVITPCGRCRQLIFEAAQVAKVDTRVICANMDLSKILATTISALLPSGFGPKDLKETGKTF